MGSISGESQIDQLESQVFNLIDKAGNYVDKLHDVRNWEIFGGVDNSAGIKIEKGFLKRSSISQSNAITVRLYGNQGNIGSCSITRLSENQINDAIDRAFQLMKVSKPNPEFIGLAFPPENQKYPNVKSKWDSEVSELEISESNEITSMFLSQKKRDDRIKSISGGFGYGDSRIKVINSNGINIQDRGTNVSISVEYIMEEIIKGKKDHSTGHDWQTFNDIKSLEAQTLNIFDSAYKLAKAGLNKVQVETKTYPVLLSPSATELLICSPICSAASADAIYQKRSFLLNKLNSQIGNDLLEITDNPWLKEGIETSPFDIEGIPTSPLNIVEKGNLKNFFHNVYTANLFNTKSTGSASRSWYSASIGISSSNVLMKKGTSSLDSMISDIKDGIFIDYSFDSPNIVTGEFSGLITSGFRIVNGKIKGSLKETMLGANLLDLFSKIELVSKEVIRKGSYYLPYVKISELSISGSN
jgi:PmbA protein